MADVDHQKLREVSSEIDAYYDALLYDGMPFEHAAMIEQQREEAHGKLYDHVVAKLARW